MEFAAEALVLSLTDLGYCRISD